MTFPAFRSRFSFARRCGSRWPARGPASAGRGFARGRRRRSGGGRASGAAIYTRARAARKALLDGFSREFARPQVEVELSGRYGRARSDSARTLRRLARGSRDAASSAPRARGGPAPPASGSRKLAVPTATAAAPGGERSSASARARSLPSRSPGSRPRRRRGDLLERDRPHRRARQPAAAGAEPGRSVAGSIAAALAC